MPGRRRKADHQPGRRGLDQNFLVDDRLINRFVAGLSVAPGELIVDIGAGSGALTVPLAQAGATVWAVEPDPHWAVRLARETKRAGVGGQVRVIGAGFQQLRLPRQPYRVVANPPFSLTSELLALLLDDPDRGPTRADLILQAGVVRSHTSQPPAHLRTAGWSPWWQFHSGMRIDRTAFRPVPTVDATVLTIHRRSPPLLPTWLAPTFPDLLRPAWGRQPS